MTKFWKSLIFGLKMKKSHIANMRLLQKFVIFWLFWTHFIYPVICCRYWYQVEKNKNDKKLRKYGIFRVFFIFSCHFWFFVAISISASTFWSWKIFTSKSWYGPPKISISTHPLPIYRGGDLDVEKSSSLSETYWSRILQNP